MATNPYRIFKTLTDISEVELKYANIFTRTASFAADVAIALLLCVPIVIKAMEYFVRNVQEGQIVLPFYNILFAPIAIGVVFTIWFVSAILESSFMRGTPGKWLAGNAVVNGFGNQIGFYKAFGRQVIKYNFLLLAALFPFVDMQIFFKLILFVSGPIIAINLFLVLFHSEKQAFHDITFSTYVIHKRTRNILMPFIVFIVSVAVSFFVVDWLKNKVILEAIGSIPPKTKETIFKALINGTRDVVVKVGEHNPAVDTDEKKVQSIQVAPSQAFEYVTNLIYEESLAREIKDVIEVDKANEKMLNEKGPTYTTIEYIGSYGYEFKTYLPDVPNLIVNPGAFTLTVFSAYDRKGSMLTPQIDNETKIEQKIVNNVVYLVVRKKVTFAQSSPVEKIDGAITLRLPIHLQSDSVSVLKPVSELNMGDQVFFIRSITEKMIEFTHVGSPEYFLGVTAYQKGSTSPLIGNFKVLKDHSMRTTYTYEFDRVIDRYEFNTAVDYHMAKFAFSSNDLR